ncbi:hypothetical protein GWO61_00535 [Corynebacterium macginleyi]|uniref:hypothetical protein n=1 Tax=Corynebacterium macginleyi TaxID=38290 RepID=UPI00190C90CC|nr:hypothetical protein [Corynebacterium macginleyi]MBK4149597.1 hypothetical protein [Corynebacterium macginleyi]MBK4166837.1 hypothetical protein [Corynebacterium macginleyi]
MIFPIVILFFATALSIFLSFATFSGKKFEPFSSGVDLVSSMLYASASIFYGLAIYLIIELQISLGAFSSFFALFLFFWAICDRTGKSQSGMSGNFYVTWYLGAVQRTARLSVAG